MSRFAGRLIGGDQPRLEAEPAAAVYDGCRVFVRGYIANAAALIAESRRRGEILREPSSAALVAKAYRWWGEKLQSHVLGEYAVAVFDERASQLLLTHDALGLVPIFYFERAGTFAFASHLEDLVPLVGTDHLDDEYIAHFLATALVKSERTPFTGVRRLLPGYSLLRTHKRTELRKTWNIAGIEPLTLASDEEYAERFRTLFCEGVLGALPGEGKVWCELSGGLDSSSVVSVAARLGVRELEAVSYICSSSRSADESAWMRAVLAEHPLGWHTLDGDEARPFSELPDRFFAEPSCAATGVALRRRCIALAGSHGVRVILTGEGGDQVCCGDRPKPYYLADFLPWRLARLWGSLRRYNASDPEQRSLMHLFLANVLRPSARYWTGRSLTAAATLKAPAWIRPDYRRRMRLDKRNAESLVPRCRSVGQQYLAERVSIAGFAPTVTGESDADSVEFRRPFFYRPLVEFMLAIPWEQNLQPDQDRVLQRRALAGILPEAIRRRTDKGHPSEIYFEGLRNNSPWVQMLVDRPRIVERGYVDGRLWREAVNQARYGRTHTMRHFMTAASLEIWLRQLEDVGSEVTCAMAGRS